MNLPQDTVTRAKDALMKQWNDIATIQRDVDENQTTITQTIYENIPCHLSQTNMPILNTDQAAGMTEPVFTLFVSTDVQLKDGDTITAQHEGQTFSGLAGPPFNRLLSNSAKLSGVKIS